MNAEVVKWVMSNFLPFEAELRMLLRRVCAGPAEIDDVIQEVYAKVLEMPGLDHVRDPRAFLVRTAKNLVIDRMRRDAIVNIEAVAKLEELEIEDDFPNPERVTMARAELKWVIGLIANLPARCKAVFRSRRIYGLSQKETAETIGISVALVDYETARGLELISKMIEQVGLLDAERTAAYQNHLAKTSNVNDL